MNYYAELGVSRDASEREIRQAYRVLVRLLHPDTQTGDDLRVAAERQLSRLNEILAVLTSVDARRAYDLSLERGWTQRNAVVPPSSVPPSSMESRRRPPAGVPGMAREGLLVARFALKHWAMVLIGVVIVAAAALLVLLRSTNGEAAATPQTAHVQPESDRPAAKVVLPSAPKPEPPLPSPEAREEPAPTRPVSEHRARTLESNVPRSRIAPRAADNPARLAEAPDARSDAKLATVPAQIAKQEPALGHPSPPVSKFSGNWFYTTDLPSPQEMEGYRAVYVELLLSEKDGALSGNYRARYVIPDRAISPQVSFHIQGRATSEREARVEWSAASGARGQAELSLNAPGIMEFRWWSTELGQQSELASGMAKLVRQRTP